jgi:glycine cleavage system H lipoate-binding protein
MFAIVITVGYFLERRQPRYMPGAAGQDSRTGAPPFPGRFGMDVPEGYLFHPCHTWAFDDGWQGIRVGLDNFAALLFGKVDQITVTKPNRWVRQGQKLMTITFDGVSVDLPSPVEGTILSLNGRALETPSVVESDPLHEGWLAVIKAASFDSDRKNLIPPAMSEFWMRNSMFVLQKLCSQEPALAQDGGRLVSGVLKHISRELRNKIVKEFFLTAPVEVVPEGVQHTV